MLLCFKAPRSKDLKSHTCLRQNYILIDCAYPEFKKDGECDDENNFEACQYDGGDCCGPNVLTDFCTACLCLDPSFGGSTDSGNTAGKIMQIRAHLLFFAI